MSDPETVVSTDNANGITPGRLEGAQFGVTPDGAATYSLPLWVPPGRLGIQPTLALQYHSRGGNGWLGVGWSLSGIPQITRCKKTIADDGTVGPIRFDSTDEFCLDGERLTLVNGTHGEDGAEYRTERDTFTKIILHDVDSAPDGHILGPTWFEAFSKDGRVLTFGGIGNSDLGSRFEGIAEEFVPVPMPPSASDEVIENAVDIVHTQVRYAWSLSSMRDRSGNMLQIYYDEYPSAPGAPRDYLPTEILYTSSPTDQMPALRAVHFVWEDRPDPQTRFMTGLRLVQKKRLKELHMGGPDPVDTGLLRQYVFSYRNDSVSGRSLLSSVQEFDRFGVAKGAHSLEWELGQSSFRQIDTGITNVRTTPTGRSTLPGRIRIADFNGDGRDDILYVPMYSEANIDPNQFYILLADESSPTGFAPPFPTGIPVPPDSIDPQGPPPIAGYPYIFPDAAGDWMNILILDNSTQGFPTYRVYHAGIDRTGASGSVGSFWVFPGKPIFDTSGGGLVEGIVELADLDGDGLPDLLRGDLTHEVPEWYLRTNLGGDLNFADEQYVGAFSVDHYFANLNGDTATALLIDASASTGGDPRYSVLQLQRQGTAITTSISLTTLLRRDQQYVFADVTGSGLPSALSLGYINKSDATLAENVGGSFATPIPFVLPLSPPLPGIATIPQPPSPDTPLVRVMDWDQDGIAELILRQPLPVHDNDPQRTDLLIVLKWTGSGFTQTTLPFASFWQNPEQFAIFEVCDVNGDGIDDIIMFSGLIGDEQLRLFIPEGKKADMMTAIVDGLGARTAITYAPISDPTVHFPGYGFTYPQRAVAAKIWVVAEYQDDNGIGGVNTYHFHYEQGIQDVTGEGFLGFTIREVVQVETGTLTLTTYNPLAATQFFGRRYYPLLGLPMDEDTWISLGNGATRVITKHYEYAVRKYWISPPSFIPYFVFPQETVENTIDYLNTGPTTPRRRTITQDMDEYGNITQYNDVWGDGNRYSFRATYHNDRNMWLIGLQETIEEISASPGGQEQTRRRAYEYDDQGLLARVIIEPGAKGPNGYLPLGPQPDGVQTLFRSIERYPDGNIYRIVEEETTDPTGTKRSTTFVYDSEHLFPTEVVDDLGHHLRATYHPGLAVIASLEDENGVRRVRQYDGFGRFRHEASPDWNDITVHYLDVSGGQRVTVERAAGPQLLSDYDVLGRVVSETIYARDDGAATLRERAYDGFGRVARVSRPHFAGDTPVYDTFAYDNLGRPTVRSWADGTGDTIEYRGEWIIATNANQHATALRLDNLDRVVFSTDRDAALVGSTPGPAGMTYNYGPFNTLLNVTDIVGNHSDMTSDRLGRLIELHDPDRGHRLYQYNAFGDLEQVAKGSTQIVQYHYDALDRLYWIEDPVDGDVQYTWDTASYGKLAQIAIPSTGVTTAYEYDSVGRLSTKTWTIGSDSYAITQRFDGVGRLAAIYYPPVGTFHPLVVFYEYGNFGQLLHVVDAAANHPIWDFVSADASGMFGQEELGKVLVNSWTEDPARPGVLKSIQTMNLHKIRNVLRDLVYGFDANLNVVSREDLVLGTQEVFEYDRFDRLHRRTWEGPAGTRRTRWDYDDLGNLLLRAVEAGPGKDLTYTYNPAVAGPHAVTSTTLGAYAYDAKGNQTSAPGRTVTYGRQDLPTRVMRTSGNAPEAVTFVYDGEMSRVRTIDEATGITTETVGGLYEFRRLNSQQSPTGEHFFTVVVNGRPVAQKILRFADDTVTDIGVEFLHRDHQGSIDLVTSDTGGVNERLKYDPFGQRVSATDPAKYLDPPGIDLHTGYTGQEHVDGWKLIDMKGRFYDPTLGKFLTPDPFIPSPIDPQSWNRYAYVGNNPLTLRDPTGFQDEDEDGEDEDTVSVSGNTTRIDFSKGSTVVGNTTRVSVSGNTTTIEFSKGSTVTGNPPPPPPPPKNDDGTQAAALGPPINAGLMSGNRGGVNQVARAPSELQSPRMLFKPEVITRSPAVFNPEAMLRSSGVLEQVIFSHIPMVFEPEVFVRPQRRGWGFGISGELSLISGGGGVVGFNAQYTSSTGWGFYRYYVAAEDWAGGFSVGVGGQLNIVTGHGPWSGPFVNILGGWGPGLVQVSGSYFQTANVKPGEDPGYAGLGIGGSVGLPYPSLAATKTTYVPIWGGQ